MLPVTCEVVYLSGLNGPVSHDWWAVVFKTDGLWGSQRGGPVLIWRLSSMQSMKLMSWGNCLWPEPSPGKV